MFADDDFMTFDTFYNKFCKKPPFLNFLHKKI